MQATRSSNLNDSKFRLCKQVSCSRDHLLFVYRLDKMHTRMNYRWMHSIPIKLLPTLNSTILFSIEHSITGEENTKRVYMYVNWQENQMVNMILKAIFVYVMILFWVGYEFFFFFFVLFCFRLVKIMRATIKYILHSTCTMRKDAAQSISTMVKACTNRVKEHSSETTTFPFLWLDQIKFC